MPIMAGLVPANYATSVLVQMAGTGMPPGSSRWAGHDSAGNGVLQHAAYPDAYGAKPGQSTGGQPDRKPL